MVVFVAAARRIAWHSPCRARAAPATRNRAFAAPELVLLHEPRDDDASRHAELARRTRGRSSPPRPRGSHRRLRTRRSTPRRPWDRRRVQRRRRRGIAHIGVLRDVGRARRPDRRDCRREHRRDRRRRRSTWRLARRRRGSDPGRGRRQVARRSHVPTVSFASGARVTHHIKEGAQGLDLEDTWLNFFCVSTNLTRGALEIHDRGTAWAAVRVQLLRSRALPTDAECGR